MDRDRRSLAGAGLVALGGAGYLVGALVAYPGRAFSLTALMVGVTLLAVGGAAADGDERAPPAGTASEREPTEGGGP